LGIILFFNRLKNLFNKSRANQAGLLYFYSTMNSKYEHRKQPLAPKKVFYKRLWNNFLFAGTILLLSLAIGIVGYKITVPEFDWYDSLLNASMILSGMGPIIDVNIVLTKSAKIFASAYALFSGVTFISTIGIVIAPIAHRFFHKLHLEEQ
jgi:hypothetical protein